MRWLSLTSLFLTLLACAAQDYRISRPTQFSGMSDASAGMALTTNLFVAASDEIISCVFTT